MSRSRLLFAVVIGGTLALGACGDPASAPVTPAVRAVAAPPMASTEETSCLAGTYFNGTDCVPAAPGYFVATDGATSQTPCPLGAYQDEQGATSCKLAPIGTYAPFAALRLPMACPTGTTTLAVGATDVSQCVPLPPPSCDAGSYSDGTTCVLASPGYYVPTAGATSQTACAPGSYQPNAGSTSCLLADIGRFVLTSGATFQYSCPPGTTTLARGSTSALQCVWPYSFGGFAAPLDPNGVNVAKAGSAVPVKFSLGGDQGLAILAAGFPTSASVQCTGGAQTTAPVETETAGGSSLTYDAETDQYKYVWKTEKSWDRSCRRLMLKLADGSVHTLDFQFSK